MYFMGKRNFLCKKHLHRYANNSGKYERNSYDFSPSYFLFKEKSGDKHSPNITDTA